MRLGLIMSGIPAKAGIQLKKRLDPRFRGGDEKGLPS
jgi:hypothetical protein